MSSNNNFQGVMTVTATVVVVIALAWPVRESFINAVHQRDAAFLTRQKSGAAYIEQNYRTLCQAYRDASFIARLTTYSDRTYCKKYLDRFREG